MKPNFPYMESNKKIRITCLIYQIFFIDKTVVEIESKLLDLPKNLLEVICAHTFLEGIKITQRSHHSDFKGLL